MPTRLPFTRGGGRERDDTMGRGTDVKLGDGAYDGGRTP